MMTRLLGLTALLLCLTASGDAEAQSRSSVAGSWRPDISVTHVTEELGRQPSFGVEVVLEQWAQSPRGGLELKGTQVGRTNKEGRVSFKRVPIQRGARYSATTIRDGVTFSTVQISGIAPTKPIDLQTFEQTSSTEALKFDVRAELEVREEVVLVKMRVGITNQSTRVIMAPLDKGVRAPMLLPAIGDKTWVGYLPTEKATGNINLRTNPKRGVLRVHRGSVFFSGPIFPGPQSQEWGIAYVLPIHEANMDLVLQSDHEVSSLGYIGAWTNGLAPQISSSLPYDSKKFERAGRIIHSLNLRESPPEGYVPRLTITGLPYALSAESNLALFGGGFLFILFLLFALGIRPKE